MILCNENHVDIGNTPLYYEARPNLLGKEFTASVRDGINGPMSRRLVRVIKITGKFKAMIAIVK